MSDKNFDDKIRETLEGHEPEVNANWGKMKDRIAAAAAIGAIGLDVAGSKIATQLSIAAAVVIGAGTMWLAQTFFVEDDFEKETSIAITVDEDAHNIDEQIAFDPETLIEESVVAESSDIKLEVNVNSNPVEEKPIMITADNTTSVNEDKVEDRPIIESSPEVFEELEPEELEVVPFTASATSSCVGVKVDFVVEDIDALNIYLWNFGDGSFSSEAAPTHTYDKPGIFDVTLSMRSPGTSIKTKTIKNLVEIHPQPTAVMSWEFPRTVKGNTVQIVLVDNTELANSATWLVDGEIIEFETPVLNIPGKYDLNLIASNQFGCQDHVSKTIVVGDRQQLNAPARFSPDGDGRYDTFMPFGLLSLSDRWQLVISNEEGKEVFVSDSAENSWGGILEDGTVAINGSHFYWTVICTDFHGNKRLYSDIINVER
jgi:PKD repeat protein